ncbi:MAG: hypothetical protein RL662_570 [Bacteroidota bacterium]|jgi:hypothetical protein
MSVFLFYLILLGEAVFLPFFCIYEYLRKKQLFANVKSRRRNKVIDSKLYVCIHEWGGYTLKRNKEIKNIRPFNCGLFYQLERFNKHKQKYNIDLTVTLSDSHLCKEYDYITSHCDRLICVDNLGFDFSGYSSFFDKIKNKENAYIILSNSSVNEDIVDFIDGYLFYLNRNPDVGLLGISYSSSMQQTLIRNNFKPHIQSFFILTTIDVLKEIALKNNGNFPGKGIDHKLLLIREGEIKLSTLALNLGYSLAVVLESGKVFKFNKTNKTQNCYSQWSNVPRGDMRVYVDQPNKINKIRGTQ